MTEHQHQADPWHMAILIPARNEEVLLGRCLRSVQRARQALPPGITTDVVVASDCSTDRTSELAATLLQDTGLVARISAGCVGVARAVAARFALARHHGVPSLCWLANTDADCIVPEDWLLHQLALATRSVAAVAGIVDVDTFEEHQSTVEAMFRLTYLLHGNGTHPHVHGANLGVRGDVYLAAGGWGEQSTAEDHDLWRRVGALKEPCLSDATLKVLTSGRRVGRAPDGFADALAAHNEVHV